MAVQILSLLHIVRIPEQNDCVIFTVLGCMGVLLLVLQSLNREATVRDFMMQALPDSHNVFLSWALVSVVFCTLFAMLLSQYIPIVPAWAAYVQLFGLQLNKIGFALFAVASVALIATILGYFLYLSTHNEKRWQPFYFYATKFYLALSVILIAANVVHYYFSIDKEKALRIYLPLFGIIFIIKNIYYLLIKPGVLPAQWYYKFLYICTLQIVPVLVLWRLLFL